MLNFADLNVLIVDDEVSILELLRYLFVDRGSRVSTAGDGRMALDELQHSKFDVVISDFRMPRLNGMSLLESMRSIRPEEAPPAVILISGYQYLQNDQALDKGASALLSKPLEHERLLELARRYATPVAERWMPVLDSKTPKAQLKLELGDAAQRLSDGRFSFGKGGFFVQVDNVYLEPGELVNLDINFKDASIPAIKGVGEVRWARAEDSSLAFGGYGVEILSIADESRAQLVGFIERHSKVGFIPIGNRAA